MENRRRFADVPPVTDRDPVALNLGDRVDINGTVLLVRGTSVAFAHSPFGATAGVIDLAPVPPKPKPAPIAPKRGEVWRRRASGALYVVAYLVSGEDDARFVCVRGGPDDNPGIRWSDHNAPWGECGRDAWEFYADNAEKAFAFLRSES